MLVKSVQGIRVITGPARGTEGRATREDEHFSHKHALLFQHMSYLADKEASAGGLMFFACVRGTALGGTWFAIN